MCYCLLVFTMWCLTGYILARDRLKVDAMVSSFAHIKSRSYQKRYQTVCYFKASKTCRPKFLTYIKHWRNSFLWLWHCEILRQDFNPEFSKWSVSVPSRTQQKNPTEHLTMVEPQNSLIFVSEHHRIRRLADFKALKL